MRKKLTEIEKDEFREILEKDGLQACLKEAGNHPEAIMICEGLNYDFFVGAANIIAEKFEERETNKYHMDYIGEKMRQLTMFGDTITRFDEKRNKKWRNVYNTMLDEGF